MIKNKTIKSVAIKLIGACILTLFGFSSQAQCPQGTLGGTYDGSGLVLNVPQNITTTATGGTYFSVSGLIAGNEYQITSCGSDVPSGLNVYLGGFSTGNDETSCGGTDGLLDLTVPIATTYAVQVNSDLCGSLGTAMVITIELTVSSACTLASTTVGTDALCNGDATGGATVTATGGTTPYAYNWAGSETTASVTGLAAGTYGVTVLDANACASTSTVIINEPTQMVLSTTSTDALCFGSTDGMATAVVSGGTMPYSYTWDNGANGSTISGLAASTYTPTCTDSNGCLVSASVVVNEPSELTSVMTSVNVVCNGNSDGAASVLGLGGVGSYTYAWNTGGMTANESSLSAGTSIVTTTDGNGCQDVNSVVITEPSALIVDTLSVTNATCGGSNGSVSVSGFGGVAPYSYNWSNGENTATINGLAVGIYTYTAMDANGCTDVNMIMISDAAAAIISVSSTTDLM
ncbi:MAG: SprB repeat-containing protein, partial [Flavobacteriales bacterium]|nr:SprB repeat-containing protein [Flavobacteriales bacterium]